MKADTERTERMRQALTRVGLDAMVCRLPENVLLLSGYWPMVGWSFVVFSVDSEPIYVIPQSEQSEAEEALWEGDTRFFPFGTLSAGNHYQRAASALKDAVAGKDWNRIGYEGSSETIAATWYAAEQSVPASTTVSMLREVFSGAKLVDATYLLNVERARKTPAEIEKLRKVNEISVFGINAFRDKLRIGATGVELVAEVEHAIMIQGTGHDGASLVRAFAQVATGKHETANAFRFAEIPTSRKIESGDLVMLELAVVADGFWCDRTRTRVTGKATQQQVDLFQTVTNAQAAAIDRARVGVCAGDTDEAARSIIRAAGYAEHYPHVTGHGLGFRYHEPIPLIGPGEECILEPGMVHTVEPGIYVPSVGGVRLEDVVLVGESGPEILGPCSRELC